MIYFIIGLFIVDFILMFKTRYSTIEGKFKNVYLNYITVACIISLLIYLVIYNQYIYLGLLLTGLDILFRIKTLIRILHCTI